MKKLFLFLAAAVVLCSTAASETFVVSRNGLEVSSTRDGKIWAADSSIDRKDPTSVLVLFFVSYFSKDDGWHDLITHYIFPGSSFDEVKVTMSEAWEGFYGKVDSVRITINPAAFKSNGDGRAFYTVKISASYQGESAEGEDQVTMEQDENGNWFVAELPM